ncbi:NAD-dependent 4,6-dehydratase LegB [Verrucomicrobiota bacterium]
MSEFWHDKKVAVTGADGFIGSHLVEMLIEKGASVRALAYYNSFGSRGWLDDVDKSLMEGLEVMWGDVRDSRCMNELVKDREIVFHLASLIAIPYSYQAPQSYVQTNVVGGLNVLEACRDNDVSRLIHTSTSEVYGTAQYVPIDEKHGLQPQSPYSATKIAADMIADSYYRSFGLPVAIARPFNTYGPRQSARAVIPTILSQLHKGMTEIKLGAVSPTRDFNYVVDTCSGFLAIAENDQTCGKVTNIGSGREISIKDLFDLCVKVTGKKAKVIADDKRLRPDKSEVNRLMCDDSEIKSTTGWKPAFTLEEGLHLTSEWIEDHLDIFRPEEYNI